MKEYIVTCKNFEDLQSLYDDMETPGGNLYIPDRAVELVQRRNISRNTHYMLTEAEANEVSQDSRVLACELNPLDQGIEFAPHWTQTGDFEKTTGTLETDDKNWGLYRMIKGDSVSSWGSDSTTEISNQTINTTSSGKNVDVVIADSHVNPNHPEFAVNPDGTGGSRVNQFNWYQYSSALGYSGTPATYTYSTSGASPNENHGTHVAGTACGNTQGWARDANIYNIAFSGTLSGYGGNSWAQYMWDYVRYFHKNKPINTTTGRRNPTVMNNSWGSSYGQISLSLFDGVSYRGTFTDMSSMSTTEKRTTLEANGNPCPFGSILYRPPARNAAIDADLQDAINDGVIVIASAGNSYWNCEISTGQDYNNYLTYNSGLSTIYFTRGSSPGSADNVICVGSIGSKVAEYKSNFSNWGSRVDIWAPGSDIISAVFDQASATAEGYGSTPQDPRNSSYHLASISGTSMAGPQVAGIIACLVEQEPNLTQAEALQHLIENSLTEVGSQGLPEQSPYEGFGDSLNRYAFIPKKRPDNGMASPAQLHKNRNTSTIKYPRVRYQTTS
jgi:subtilisin family serine protease